MNTKQVFVTVSYNKKEGLHALLLVESNLCFQQPQSRLGWVHLQSGKTTCKDIL